MRTFYSYSFDRTVQLSSPTAWGLFRGEQLYDRGELGPGITILIPGPKEAAKRRSMQDANAARMDHKIAANQEAERLAAVARDRGASPAEAQFVKHDYFYAAMLGKLYKPRMDPARRAELIGPGEW